MKRPITTAKIIALASIIYVSQLASAPLPLANAPLYLDTGVRPNVFLMLDDSGSMDWSTLVSDSNNDVNSNGTFVMRNRNYYYTHPAPGQGYSYRTVPHTRWLELLNTSNSLADLNVVWRIWNKDYNQAYYDPSYTYVPWQGKDINGQTYANANPQAVRVNPYNASAGTFNLTVNTAGYITRYNGIYYSGPGFYPAFYYTWSDSDEDGYVDGSDSHSLVEIRSTNNNYAGGPNRVDCGDTPEQRMTCTYSQEIQNFANWFSYYRKRELTMKHAVSELISQSSTRAGIGTLHDNNNVGIPIENIDTLTTTPGTEEYNSALNNKNQLLSKLFQADSSGGTPLRIGLREVGRYFEQSTNTTVFGSASSSNPILSAENGGACQQNFAILLTDGYWNGDSPGVGNTDNATSSAYDGGSHADSFSNTLADVAMHYYERDLAPSLANDLTTSAVDPNPKQHMVTYTVAFGLSGALQNNPSDRESVFNWPQPIADQPSTIDDLRHAAWNGRGQFLSAKNPQDLIEAFNDAFKDIISRNASSAALSFNTTSLQSSTKLFQAGFNSSFWTGTLEAYPITNGIISNTPLWNAEQRLADLQDPNVSRVIITRNGGDSMLTGGIPFRWPSNYPTLASSDLSESQVNDLLTVDPDWESLSSSQRNTLGQKIVEYYRGSRVNEGQGSDDFRPRGSTILGDITHSSPVVVGKPAARYDDHLESTAYSQFVSQHSQRAEMVYVGANDNMLHGFDSQTGDEKFAYIPKVLFSGNSGEGLHYYAQKTYSHKYGVDVTPSVGDAFFNPPNIAGSTAKWRTVLVGGLGAGGKGIYALDVTDPTQFANEDSASNVVMWEFTHANLGYTFSQPQIVRLNNDKWAAIFANGYNNTGTGTAGLYIVYLDGSNLSTPIFLDTQAGSSSTPNGINTVTVVDLNADGNIDRVYGGDLLGNLWAFDIKSNNPSNWGSAYLSGSTPQPLFTATDANGAAQPITIKPSIARHPDQREVATAPNLLVFFGTGRYIADGDESTTQQQSFYAVWDSGVSGLTKNNLQQQVITNIAGSGSVPETRSVTNHTVNYDSQQPHYGWYIPLGVSIANTTTFDSERVIVRPINIGELIIFTTFAPTDEKCSNGGEGFVMILNMLNGHQPSFGALDINGDDAIDTGDKVQQKVTAGMRTVGGLTGLIRLSNQLIGQNTKLQIDARDAQFRIPINSGRSAWTMVNP